MRPAAEQAQFLERNAVDSLPEGELGRRIAEAAQAQRPLRVKLGIDPTAPDIHLGHTVVLSKLREFQDEGHTVVLIIGDYTARVGDPTGRSKTRPVLSAAQIDTNAETFKRQAFKILDRDRVEVRNNSEWLNMPIEQLFGLLRIPTVAQMLERDDFAARYKANEPIALLELLYPVLQGYDSVAIESDVELGGTDQKFNLLVGRQMQEAMGQRPQSILTMTILPGTDGIRRMGKSLGNHIGVAEDPEEIFGKAMSIPDEAMSVYYDLLLGTEPNKTDPPVAQKRLLARELAERFHPGAGKQAEAHFDLLHKEHALPDEVEEATIALPDGDVHLPALIAEAFGETRSAARRLLRQGGVQVDGDALGPESLDVPRNAVDGRILQIGKRRFKRIRLT